ncbi:MAG: tetratricopeptide repeat protein [Treponema sp.]|jgi:tetratricopeptide (TPR) repeat protein|nr:tetratricopeptide repeat protein [Treponema sp.]
MRIFAKGGKRGFFTAFLVLVPLIVPAWEVPRWFIPLREAVFAQVLKADEVAPLYRQASAQARDLLSGAEKNAMLSRCEYMMGRAFQQDERRDEALSCYEKGIALAEQSIAEEPSAAAYEILAAHYGQICMLKPAPWVMSNGPKVEQYAKKASALDSRNAGSKYLLASRWAFGPGILGDPKRGISEMTKILSGGVFLQKDDYFNVYSAIGYAHLRLNQKQEALVWIKKALELYPTNKFALQMRDEAE